MKSVSNCSLETIYFLWTPTHGCPCGYYTDPKKECNCSSLQIKNYMSRISGPLLDRIDIQLEVPALKAGEITAKGDSEPSEAIRARVEAARARQRERYKDEGISSNAELGARQVEKYCRVTSQAEELLRMGVVELGFSARAYHKCLKVARTIADLEGEETIGAEQVSEAVHYRALDKTAWLR